MLALAGVSGGSWAQELSAPAPNAVRAWSVAPSLAITQTFTDNVRLNDAAKRSDAVTVLTAGLSLSGRSARVQGTLDYQLAGSMHARESSTNGTANSLRAALKSEWIDNVFFVDAGANISQSLISAFGAQPVERTSDHPNVTEVRSFNVAPTLRGTLGGQVRVDARLNHAQQSSANTAQGDFTTDTGSVTLGPARPARLGWTAVASRHRTSYGAGRSTATDSYTGGLNYRVDSDLLVSGRAGRERSDVITRESSNSSTYGMGVEWTPTERTRLAAQADHRYFGNAHTLSFDHRMSRSMWRISSSRDVSASSPSYNDTGSVALGDLLFARYASVQPDPTLRRQLVEQELVRLGYGPDQRVSPGFLNAATMLVSRQEVSVALQGIRTTLTLNAYRSDSRRVDRAANVFDDLSAASHVRLRGFTLTLGHRLTPETGLSLTHSQNRNRGSTLLQSSDMRSTNLNWTTRLGVRSNFSLGLRHVEFDNATTPYNENALIANLGLNF
ncbi:MAG: TIGR03016 family PEP-CTERM system-associated outer membrane protein [Burkholderiales bacterium]|nr:TIGR03016 family PEP-CTERM system-associated outer membrane protein [Burkholderiales bacterium]